MRTLRPTPPRVGPVRVMPAGRAYAALDIDSSSRRRYGFPCVFPDSPYAKEHSTEAPAGKN